jgi:3-isopropylmalate dehydratase
MAAAAALNGKLTDVRKYPNSQSTASVSLEITSSVDFVNTAAKPSSLPATRDAPISTLEKTTPPVPVKVPTFTVLKGIAAPLENENIDTDVIISAKFLTSVKRTGFGKHLFHALRFSPHTGEKTDFVLNNAPYDKSSIIVCTGANFGCGSSREAAPWSLWVTNRMAYTLSLIFALTGKSLELNVSLHQALRKFLRIIASRMGYFL